MSIIPYSKKTATYWHQIYAMSKKLGKFAVINFIPMKELDEAIEVLEQIRDHKITELEKEVS